jgi:hypothetical protein
MRLDMPVTIAPRLKAFATRSYSKFVSTLRTVNYRAAVNAGTNRHHARKEIMASRIRESITR